MPAMGLALLICYIWGRYYAAKLDYAYTVQNLLEDNEEESEDEANSEYQESEEFFQNVLKRKSKEKWQNDEADASSGQLTVSHGVPTSH